MTPEETVNLEIWEILQRIKEESLVPEEDGTFFYDTTYTVIATGHPSPTIERKWSVVRKFAREKAIEITKEITPDWRSTRNGFYLKVLQPKFDEVYKKYQKLCSDTVDEDQRHSKSDNQEKNYAPSNIVNTPIKIVIADLKSKHQEIEQEKNSVQFFIKIAQYGKYILENHSSATVLSSLYQEAKDDAELYIKAWKEFIKVWKLYAKDILEKAEQAGIKDNPNNPLSSEVGNIKSKLNDEETSVWESDLGNYYLPYQTLIWKFNRLNKSALLIPKHMDAENKSLAIYPIYNTARDEWDKFKYSREATVWWAHYQICRLAAGVLDIKGLQTYFKRNNVIDGFYKYEFNELARGNISRNPIVLHADRYAVWIKRLHEYLIPRLETSQEEGKASSIKQEKQVLSSHRLSFYPEDGHAEYRTAIWRFKGKSRALLTYLDQSKNIPLSIEDIRNKCNTQIMNKNHYFKAHKDIRDTIDEIRFRLKVNTGEFFPIHKQDDFWIWLQK